MLAAIPDDPRDALRSVLPADADAATDVSYLVTPDRKKNLLVRFRRGGDDLVLKIYRDSAGHVRQSLSNPLLEHVVGAYSLRVTGRRRVVAERASIEGFAAAGFSTLDLVAQPTPDALLFRYVAAQPLDTLLRRSGSPDVVRTWIARVAADLAARQAAALERADRRLLHPHPRLTHILVDPRDRLIHHDFEGVVNPSLDLSSALGLEVECFLSYLGASAVTRDRVFLDAATEALGREPVARWRAVRRKPLWFLSGSARNRVRRLGWLGDR